MTVQITISGTIMQAPKNILACALRIAAEQYDEYAKMCGGITTRGGEGAIRQAEQALNLADQIEKADAIELTD
jgi:hypothetical protein